MRIPPVTEALLRRLAGTSRAFWARWMKSIRDQEGNPSRVEMVRFGDEAIAVAALGRTDLHWMNMTEHLYPEHAPVLDDILAFYRSVGVAPVLGVPSVAELEPVAAGLAARGAHPWRTMAVLYGGAAVPLPGPSAASVRSVDGSEIERFAAVWGTGYELGDAQRALVTTDIAAWPSFDGVRLYLADIEGVPVAAAALYVREGIGYLANASTLPSYRRRGAHGALIEQRIGDAAATGCELVCGLAVYGSPSQSNMERAGLRLAGTITQWRMPAQP